MSARHVISAAPRRAILKGAGGLAGILALGRAPAFAQAAPKKLVFAHVNAVPESAAVAFDWFAKEVTNRSKGELVWISRAPRSSPRNSRS